MKKILNASNMLACVSCVLSLVFVILYAVNVNSAGYFQGNRAANLVLLAILAMVCNALIIGRSFVKVEGYALKALDVVVFVCKVLIPLFLIFAAISLLSARIEGLGYIYFSNVDVAKEVATPANLGSAGLAIATIVVGIVTAIISVVAAFFLPKHPEVEEA